MRYAPNMAYGHWDYALRARSMRCAHLSLRDRNPLRFSNGVLAVRAYFFATAQKSSQKMPLSGQLTYPISPAPCYQTSVETTSLYSPRLVL